MSPQSPNISSPLPVPSFAIPITQVVPLFVTLVLLIWAIYTIVAFYHWLRYGDSLTVALGAMASHLLISSVLAVFAVSGLS